MDMPDTSGHTDVAVRDAPAPLITILTTTTIFLYSECVARDDFTLLYQLTRLF